MLGGKRLVEKAAVEVSGAAGADDLWEYWMLLWHWSLLWKVRLAELATTFSPDRITMGQMTMRSECILVGKPYRAEPAEDSLRANSLLILLQKTWIDMVWIVADVDVALGWSGNDRLWCILASYASLDRATSSGADVSEVCMDRSLVAVQARWPRKRCEGAIFFAKLACMRSLESVRFAYVLIDVVLACEQLVTTFVGAGDVLRGNIVSSCSGLHDRHASVVVAVHRYCCCGSL